MGLKRLWFCLLSAAAFFVTYDCTKSLLGAGGPLAAAHMAPVTHMLAASLGEIVSLPALCSYRFISAFFDLGPLLCCCIHSLPVPPLGFQNGRFSVFLFVISLITMQSWHRWGKCAVLAVGCELQLGGGGHSQDPPDLISAC